MSLAPDWQTSLNTAVAGVNMQVTPENVLQVRKVLLQEADRLGELSGASVLMTSQFVGLCGGDPVSRQAAQAFQTRIGQLVTQCQAYRTQLRNAGNALGETAKRYGHTDEEIANSFTAKNPELSA